jgi:hypothetical protein
MLKARRGLGTAFRMAAVWAFGFGTLACIGVVVSSGGF